MARFAALARVFLRTAWLGVATRSIPRCEGGTLPANAGNRASWTPKCEIAVKSAKLADSLRESAIFIRRRSMLMGDETNKSHAAAGAGDNYVSLRGVT